MWVSQSNYPLHSNLFRKKEKGISREMRANSGNSKSQYSPKLNIVALYIFTCLSDPCEREYPFGYKANKCLAD